MPDETDSHWIEQSAQLRRTRSQPFDALKLEELKSATADGIALFADEMGRLFIVRLTAA